jgi:glucosamine kinase
MQQYKIGIDGGGSKTRAVLCIDNNQIIDSYTAAGSNIRNNISLAFTAITNCIDYFLNKYTLNSSNTIIGIGVAGYSVAPNQLALLSQLQQKYSMPIKLASDGHIALLATHGNNNGAILICGTGIVTYIANNGKYSQIGGWGFPHGDLGGAAHLGLLLSQYLCQAIDNIIPWSILLEDLYQHLGASAEKCKIYLINAQISDFANLAQYISKHKSDIYAQKIMQIGLEHMRNYIKAIYALNANIPLSIIGGLSAVYFSYLTNEFPNLKLSTVDPAIGAILL